MLPIYSFTFLLSSSALGLVDDWLTMVLTGRSSFLPMLLLGVYLLVLLPCFTRTHGFMPMDGLKKIIKHINEREAQEKARQEAKGTERQDHQETEPHDHGEEARQEPLHNHAKNGGAGTPPRNMQG